MMRSAGGAAGIYIVVPAVLPSQEIVPVELGLGARYVRYATKMTLIIILIRWKTSMIDIKSLRVLRWTYLMAEVRREARRRMAWA